MGYSRSCVFLTVPFHRDFVNTTNCVRMLWEPLRPSPKRTKRRQQSSTLHLRTIRRKPPINPLTLNGKSVPFAWKNSKQVKLFRGALTMKHLVSTSFITNVSKVSKRRKITNFHYFAIACLSPRLPIIRMAVTESSLSLLPRHNHPGRRNGGRFACGQVDFARNVQTTKSQGQYHVLLCRTRIGGLATKQHEQNE